MSSPAEYYAPNAPIQVDINEVADADSTLKEDQSSTSTSLGTSVMWYEWKHGRRYHSYQAGQCSFPNNATKQNYLDIIYHVFFRLLGDHLVLAPIDPNGLNILDIGTGMVI